MYNQKFAAAFSDELQLILLHEMEKEAGLMDIARRAGNAIKGKLGVGSGGASVWGNKGLAPVSTLKPEPGLAGDLSRTAIGVSRSAPAAPSVFSAPSSPVGGILSRKMLIQRPVQALQHSYA